MKSKSSGTAPVIKANLYGKEFIYQEGEWVPAPTDKSTPSKNLTQEKNRYGYFSHSKAANSEAKTEPTQIEEQETPQRNCCIIM